jgi:trimethylamine---corrinoid protein Co-methyltransferase
LTHNEETIDKLIWWSRLGLPVIYIGGPSAGATAPVTMAGMLVQANAEVLSALVLNQLVCPGAPFIHGGMMHPMDMRTMLHVYGGPEMQLGNAALTEVAHSYGLPAWGGAGCNDAIVPDEQAAVDSALTCLVSALAGPNLIHDVGYIEAGLTQSFEMVVLSDEVIDMVRWLAQGIQVDEETLALDVIGAAGPGGQFLDTEHTIRHFRREIWQPGLMNRDFISGWVQQGSKRLGERVQEQVIQILETHRPPALDKTLDDTIASLTNEMIHHRKEIALC